MLLMRVFIKVHQRTVKLPLCYYFMMCIIGAIYGGIIVSLIAGSSFVGIVGYILLKSGFTLTPIILGSILGPIYRDKFPNRGHQQQRRRHIQSSAVRSL
jgi:TctA family transporter